MVGSTAAEPAPLPLDALVRRADEVRRGRTDGRVVRLVTHDGPARLATLRNLYVRLVEHPRLGGAWPWTLPPGALAPALPPTAFPGLPPRVFWFGVCAADDPVVEAAQLCEQLAQLTRFPDLPDWVERTADVACAALVGRDDRSAAERRHGAFGFLASERPDGADALRTALRTLHGLAGGPPLAGDGGLLQLDAPSPATRALVAAGWLERLARLGVLVLAVDEAERAGPFLTHLVRELAATEAPVLIVLAGEPAGIADDEPRLGGSLGGQAALAGQPLALPAGDAGYLGAALAVVSPSGVFAEEHVRVVADAIGVGDDAAVLYDELVATGWLRRLTTRVSAFGGTSRHAAAGAQVAELLGAELADRGADLCRRAADRAGVDPLSRLLAARTRARAAAGDEDDDGQATWDLALLLARTGSPGDALAMGAGAADGPLRQAHLAHWRALAGVTGAATSDATATGPAEVERRLVLAAACATADPSGAVGHLVAGLGLLADDPSLTAEDDARLRVAAARIFLTTGHVDGVAHALGPEAPSWLPAAVVKRLVELHAHRASPTLVAREVALAQARHAVDVLAELVPASRALALAQLGLVELLEECERLGTAGDEATGAVAHARAVLERDAADPPRLRWRARRWEALVQHRRGDARGAAAALAALVDEQCARVRADDPDVIDTMVRLGQVLAESQRVDEAASAVQRARRAAEPLPEDHPARLAADQAWAGVLLARGAHQEAAVLAASVVRRRAALVPAWDDTLLRSRAVLASALARDGRPAEALRHLDEVVGRRATADLPDGRRLLAARQERAGCLVMLHRYAEALVELDAVVGQRSRLVPASDVTLVSARCDRALCLLMLQRWADALVDLDPALAILQVRFAPDDERVLLMRQQRAICLHALHRTAEALAELDGIVAATAGWPRDHALVAAVVKQRGDVAASVVPVTAVPLHAPPAAPAAGTTR